MKYCHIVKQKIANKAFSGRLYYMLWENLDEFINFSQVKPLLPHNLAIYNYTADKIQNNYGSYMYDFAKSYDDIIQSTKKFRHFAKFNKLKDSFLKSMPEFKLNDGEVNNNKKLDFNDLGLGVFCFSRAAMQLRKKKIPMGEKIVSDVKKVYGYFTANKDKGNLKGKGIFIRLMLPLGMSFEGTQENMLYNALPSLMALLYFIQQGFDVEVYMRETTRSDAHYVTNVVKLADTRIKQIDDRAIEEILIACAEVRFFRTIGFLASIKAFDFFRLKIEHGLGYAVSDYKYVKVAEDILFPSQNMLHSSVSLSLQDATKELNRMIASSQQMEKTEDMLHIHSYVGSGTFKLPHAEKGPKVLA